MNDIAVIMSVYQKDKLVYLQQAIMSILTQTYSEFDYFIAIDGPVSKEIDSYISSLKDSRIHFYRLQENKGLANALNFLLKIILDKDQYKYIARMDADDVSIDLRFEIQRNFFRNNPGISCIGSWYTEIDEAGTVLSYQKLPVTHEGIRNFFLRRSPFAHPSVMFRKDMINKAGFYPTNTIRLEDYVFWSNAFKAGLVFANIPEYLLQFRRDAYFYTRRSGFKFGLNYISVRFKINKVLNAPAGIYLYSLGIGIIRMMPAFVIRFIYLVFRK